MAMKGSTVRGTPVRHVTVGARGEGERAGKPSGMEGTVHEQYSSDKRGYQSDSRSGTPYHSEDGNPPNSRREVIRSTNAESSDHGNQNDPHSNGPGVMLDVGDYGTGYAPRDEPTMDSPVPRHAPVFGTGFIETEDRAHMGKGAENQARDDLLKIGGVMSRGMVGTSGKNAPEDEFVGDADEGRETRATNTQPQGSVKHERE